MKKIFVLLAACMLAATAMMFTGCDEVKDEITSATANQWYKYNGTTSTATANAGGATTNFKQIYIYYSSSDQKLRVVAAPEGTLASSYYIKYEKDLSSSTWMGAVAGGALSGKLTSASDPTSGRTDVSNSANWGNIAENAILGLLGLN